MGLNPTRKTYGQVDRSYLVTETGVGDGIGCTLNKADWSSAEDVTDGLVPAGYPVTVDAAGIAKPYAGTGTFSGLLLNAVELKDSDAGSTGYQWYGAVDPAKLPGPTLDPATANNPRFYFAAKA